MGLLGDLGSQARAAVPTLICLLQYGDRSGSILSALQRIGPEARSATLILIELLEEEQPFVATTLVKIRADPELALPALRRASTNGPSWFRLEAASALRQIELAHAPAVASAQWAAPRAAPGEMPPDDPSW
jgi:hypothetical protein